MKGPAPLTRRPDEPQNRREEPAVTDDVTGAPHLESVLRAAPAHPVALGRDDLVLRKGQLTLLNGHATPRESMIEDLFFIADTLEAAGVRFLLVRGNDERPVLAVDWAHRKRARTALIEAMAEEPFYAKSPGSPAVLVADGKLARDPKTRVLRLYRPRIEPIGRLRYGVESAVQLEFWQRDGDVVEAPQENSLTRRTIPADEMVETSVDLYGRTWATIEGMFTTLASDVGFEIDMVFSWVDGTAIEFQRARAKRMASYVVGDGDDSEARYRQIDELKYALRSVYMFAPWVRRIFIATDSPKPAWLADDPRVTIMPSEKFFKNLSDLPTHNSHAVEAQLHRIPGISEHFLYSNDDMFFGRPVSPDLFFSPGGITKFVEADTRIGLGGNALHRSGFENAARVNRELLQNRFGRVTTRHLEHCAAPLRKSVLFEMEQEFSAEFARTAASPFRSATDISVTNSFYHYYALMTGRAVVQTEAKVRYIETTLKVALKEMDALLKKRSMDMFCLNDGSQPELGVEERTTAVISFLERYFPFPAPWEVVSSESSSDSESPVSPVGVTRPSAPEQARAQVPAQGRPRAASGSAAARERPAG
ncbi:stealth conserved region 3 domain-containing protein [Herbiconiux sp. P15]|uniref:stealth conserved region 3 domain-containing protein n=1 Tax=Herbiconiux liukaitaii TaxID=3342799 RepID=UPI0035B92AE6